MLRIVWRIGMSIKVLIADDHALLRQGIKGVLDFEDDIEFVGECE